MCLEEAPTNRIPNEFSSIDFVLTSHGGMFVLRKEKQTSLLRRGLHAWEKTRRGWIEGRVKRAGNSGKERKRKQTEHPTIRFRQYLFGRPKSPQIFGFNCSENKRFLQRTSPQTFEARGLINCYCFRKEECKIGQMAF